MFRNEKSELLISESSHLLITHNIVEKTKWHFWSYFHVTLLQCSSNSIQAQIRCSPFLFFDLVNRISMFGFPTSLAIISSPNFTYIVRKPPEMGIKISIRHITLFLSCPSMWQHRTEQQRGMSSKVVRTFQSAKTTSGEKTVTLLISDIMLSFSLISLIL